MPSGPRIPDDISPDELDPSALNELRTLPDDLGVRVARHLVAADRLLVDGDVPGARAHTREAKRLAGRVAAVREASGITAYLDGDYEEALSDLRTVRRMRGTDEYVPMMADCERGLGRPERALDLLRAIPPRSLDLAGRVEAALVSAGARADLGQVDAALLVLRAPELRRLPPGTPRARLEYAYSSLLEAAGRRDEAHDWLVRAAASDVDRATDAAERLEPDDDVTLGQEDDDPVDMADGGVGTDA